MDNIAIILYDTNTPIVSVRVCAHCLKSQCRLTELEAFVHTSLLHIKANLLSVASHLDLSPRDVLLANPVVSHSSTALMLIWCVVVDILQNSSLEVSLSLKWTSI